VLRIIKGPLQRANKALSPELFLEHVEAIASGLLLEREQGIYSFAHLTFQEYLAMLYIQERHLEQELLTHIEEGWWHETILLYSTQADATAVVEACLVAATRSFEALTLALHCADEARTIEAAAKERLDTLLQQRASERDPDRCKIIGEALLKRRLRQMRPVSERRYIDTSPLTCIEYQLFLYEVSDTGEYAPDIWPGREFPSGQESTCVLGVRFYGAQAFCRWLAERDKKGWVYRLPRTEEWEQMKAVGSFKLPESVAFWEEATGRLHWLSDGSSALFCEHILALLANSLSVLGGAALRISFASVTSLTGVTWLMPVTMSAPAWTTLSTTLPLRAIWPTTLLALVTLPISALATLPTLVRLPATLLARDPDCAVALARTGVVAGAGTLARSLVLTLALILARVRPLTLAHALARDLDGTIEIALEIYLVLFLFWRPAGISPAFEGIWLVKEHLLESQ